MHIVGFNNHHTLALFIKGLDLIYLTYRLMPVYKLFPNVWFTWLKIIDTERLRV